MGDSVMSDYDCRLCEQEAGMMGAIVWPRFIVCPVCGNKRCPRASAHWQACSGSNEDGQVGSFYGPRESWPTAGQAPGVADGEKR